MTGPQREEFWHRFDVDTFGERFLITVFLSPGTGRYSLHADHGPVEESQMAGFFMQMAGAMLSRL